VLFFIDESWQTIGEHDVGCLGAVAIPLANYNAYCRQVFALKRDVLGAVELSDSEIRGQHAFAKAAFKREAIHSDSHWLKAIRALFRALLDTARASSWSGRATLNTRAFEASDQARPFTSPSPTASFSLTFGR
jgi:hypothetical protein